MSMDLGKILKEERIKRGLSMQKLADKEGVTKLTFDGGKENVMGCDITG